ncbi:ABC transporter ATP-binding protein [bacterium]|nr:ABC transporter ATP-binding protein [bacterium]
MDEDSRGFQKGDWALIRRFGSYLRPHLALILLAIGAMAVGAGAQVLGPYLMAWGIDDHVLPGRLEGLWKIALLYLAVLAAVFAANFIQTSTIGRVGQGVCLTLRDHLYRKLQRLPFRFFDTQPVGRTVTRLTNDVEALSELVASGVVAILSDVVLLAGIVAMMLWMNVRMALVAFLFLPVLAVLTWSFRTKVRESFREIRAKLARLNAFLNERVQGMRVLRAFNASRETADRHAGINADHYDAHMRSIRLFSIYNPLVDFLGTLSVAAILWVAAGRILAGHLTFGELVAFLVYVEMFYKPIRDLAEKYNILQGALAAMEKVFWVLDQPEDVRGITAGPALRRPARIGGSVEFENVTFAYDQETVLRDVTLEIRPGEKIALVGATGAGKSTIASLLMGFYAPQSGAIRIDGHPIEDYDPATLRRRIGYITQEPFLFSGTLQENISLEDPAVSESAIREAARSCGVLSLTHRFPDGLQTRLGERGATLSAGERQLVAFARCLAFQPDLLLLDEATAAIDPATEKWLERALDAATRGRTALLIAHRLATVRSCNRIYVLQHGSVAESGTHEELLRRDGLYAMYMKLQEAA